MSWNAEDYEQVVAAKLEPHVAFTANTLIAVRGLERQRVNSGGKPLHEATTEELIGWLQEHGVG